MTKQDKINQMLAWSLEGCNISARNEATLRQQFAAKSDEEIDGLHAKHLRRKAIVEARQ